MRDPLDFVREAEEAEEPNQETCIECGRSLEHTPEGWREQGVCSGRCWAILFGETDM